MEVEPQKSDGGGVDADTNFSRAAIGEADEMRSQRPAEGTSSAASSGVIDIDGTVYIDDSRPTARRRTSSSGTRVGTGASAHQTSQLDVLNRAWGRAHAATITGTGVHRVRLERCERYWLGSPG